MRKLLGRYFKNSNAGLSLIELIISMAILAVVGTAVGGAMYISSRSYTRSAAEVNVQEEAQVASNLICDWLIDATSVEPDGSADANGVDTDTLIIVHPEGDKEVVIEVKLSGSTLVYEAKNKEDDSSLGSGVLANNVNACVFHSTFKKNRNVTISIDFEVNGRTYHSVTDSTSRSQTFVSTGSAFTPGEPILYVPDNVIYLEPGQNATNNCAYSFDAIVYGCDPSAITSITPSLDSTVYSGDTWITVSHPDDYTPNRFKITCNATNTALNSGSFTIEVNTTYGSKSQPITINIRRATKCEFSRLTDINFSTEFTKVEDSNGNVLYYDGPVVTVDLGDSRYLVGDTGAAYDRGEVGFKDPTSVKYYFLFKQGSDFVDASSYIHSSSVIVTNGTPSIDINVTQALSKDLYIVVVAEHSGYIPAGADIGSLVQPVVNNLNMTVASNPNNKPSWYNADLSAEGTRSLNASFLYTYTNSANDANAFSGNNRAYVDCVKIKAGMPDPYILDGGGIKRNTPNFRIGDLNEEYKTALKQELIANGCSETALEAGQQFIFSTVIYYSEEIPGYDADGNTIITYGPEKKLVIAQWHGVFRDLGNHTSLKTDGKLTSAFALDKGYKIRVALEVYDNAGNRLNSEDEFSTGRVLPCIPYFFNESTEKFALDTYSSSNPYQLDLNNSVNIVNGSDAYHFFPTYFQALSLKGEKIKPVIQVKTDDGWDTLDELSTYLKTDTWGEGNFSIGAWPSTRTFNQVSIDGAGSYPMGNYDENDFYNQNVNVEMLGISPNIRSRLEKDKDYRIAFITTFNEYETINPGDASRYADGEVYYAKVVGSQVPHPYTISGFDSNYTYSENYGYIYIHTIDTTVH